MGRPAFTTEKFISMAKDTHGGKYSYNKVDYISMKEKVQITCPYHGDFWQAPRTHLACSGCPRCSYERLPGGYDYVLAESGHYTGSGYLYAIRLDLGGEVFYKIGVTTDVSGRLASLKHKSNAISADLVCECYVEDINAAILAEYRIHISLTEHRELPPTSFCGYTECFKFSTPLSTTYNPFTDK